MKIYGFDDKISAFLTCIYDLKGKTKCDVKLKFKKFEKFKPENS